MTNFNFDRERMLWDWAPGLLGSKDANDQLILEEDLKPEQLAARTPVEVERDDAYLWLTAFTMKNYRSPSLPTCEALEAKHKDNETFNLFTRTVRADIAELKEKYKE